MEKEGFKSILDKYSKQKSLDDLGKNISRNASKRKSASESDACQVCGQKMDFSENQKEKEFEYKWSIHYRCRFSEIENRLDRETGVLTERKRR